MKIPIPLPGMDELLDMSEVKGPVAEINRIRAKLRERPCVNHPDRPVFAFIRDVGPVCSECATKKE